MRPSALAVLLVRAGLSQAAAARFYGINQGTVSSACASAGLRKVGLLARENPVGCQVRLSTGMECGAVPVEHFGGRDYCATHRALLEAALRGAT